MLEIYSADMADARIATEALHWITDILRARGIPYQIAGGLAANVYGSPRPLNDIDIDVPDDHLAEIVPDVREHIEFGPAHFVDDDWDLQLLTLNYHGQHIDLSGVDTVKVFDKAKGKWVDVSGDPADAELHAVLGITVPVIKPKELIFYKSILNRTINGQAIDRIDVEAARVFSA